MLSALYQSEGRRGIFGILAIFLLALLSVASLQQAWPAEMPAGAPPMPAGVPTAPAEPTVPPPSSPELDEAIRLANETINRHSATKLSDLIDIYAPKLTCFECNCTFGYTSQMLFGDVVYSINFFLNFVQSVTITGGTLQVKGGYNTIVVTTDRKLEAMPVRDVQAYDSFEIYMEDEEAAEKVAHHLMTARSLCTK